MHLPRWLRIAGFVTYAIALATATHWPKLQIESDVIERPDILIHLGAFGGWAVALLESSLLRTPSFRRRAAIAWLIAAAYAGVDEVTQQLPGVYRTACWDDYAANVTGITLSCGAWWFIRFRMAASADRRAAETPNE